jgi:hypothetical protein
MDSDKRKEQKRLAAQRYRERHSDVVKARNRDQYEKNRKDRIDYAKSYYLKNKDKRLEQTKQRYQENKELQSKKYKDFRKTNPDFVRERDRKYYIKRKYGLTLEQLGDLWVSQDGKCANTRCGSTLFRGLGGYAIDHCHSSGKVRGLLCMACNVALGHMDDRIEKLMGLIYYLRSKGVVNA